MNEIELQQNLCYRKLAKKIQTSLRIAALVSVFAGVFLPGVNMTTGLTYGIGMVAGEQLVEVTADHLYGQL